MMSSIVIHSVILQCGRKMWKTHIRQIIIENTFRTYFYFLKSAWGDFLKQTPIWRFPNSVFAGLLVPIQKPDCCTHQPTNPHKLGHAICCTDASTFCLLSRPMKLILFICMFCKHFPSDSGCSPALSPRSRATLPGISALCARDSFHASFVTSQVPSINKTLCRRCLSATF